MSGTETNRAYYEEVAAGREDYWRLMAAPLRRVDVLLAEIGRLEGVTSAADLGCGNGRLLEQIQRELPGMRLAGIDLSVRQIEENRLAHPDIEWIAADMQQPDAPVPGRAFDVIVATELVEHLERPDALMEYARRIAMPGAHFILSTQSGRIGETERRVGHVRHYTAADMRELLARHGWWTARVWNEGFPFHDLSKWIANRNPDAAIRAFSESAYGPLQRASAAALRVLFRLNSRRRGAQLFAVARLVE